MVDKKQKHEDTRIAIPLDLEQALKKVLGAHPYLTLGTPVIDGLLLSVPARTVNQVRRARYPAGCLGSDRH